MVQYIIIFTTIIIVTAEWCPAQASRLRRQTQYDEIIGKDNNAVAPQFWVFRDGGSGRRWHVQRGRWAAPVTVARAMDGWFGAVYPPPEEYRSVVRVLSSSVAAADIGGRDGAVDRELAPTRPDNECPPITLL